ncbi:MAG: hypothetical protein AAFU41_03700 [Pseudomonadota bacterium]
MIAALWIEGPLSYLEQLCLKSFLDAGHHVRLYHYGPVHRVPDGIEMADANEILPRPNTLTHARTGSPALHSDVFRYRLLAKEDRVIWADTDAYCRRPFETPTGHFFGWESETTINGGVLGLPQDSDTLSALLEHTSDDYAIPLWYGDEYAAKLKKLKDIGRAVPASAQRWGVWGPHALTYFLKQTGEDKYALPRHVLYPFSFRYRRRMLRPIPNTGDFVKPDSLSIHFYGRRVRENLALRPGGLPDEGSLMAALLAKHGIDPTEAPVPAYVPKERQRKPEGPRASYANEDPPFRAKRPNLSQISEAHGTDKGVGGHRYAEVYQLIFQHLHNRVATVIQLGAFDKKSSDPVLGSSRMWLDYLKKATLIRLDNEGCPTLDDARFNTAEVDLMDPELVTEVSDTLPRADIIIDEAMPVSHRQQENFVALFPRLKPGGVYVIEGLRWQPRSHEIPGYPKTAGLFENFQISRQFVHSEPEMQASLNTLGPEIAGCFVFASKFNTARKNQLAIIHKK